MANPNRTVAAFRRGSAWSVVNVKAGFKTSDQAEEWAKNNVKETQFYRIRSYKYGPFRAPMREYKATIYTK